MGELVTIVIAAFTLGLVTNLHCIGMCGPIAMALPLNRKSKWTVAGGITSYSVGRSLGYASLGIIVGLIGVSATLLGVLQWISIVSGILIVLFAWGHFYSISSRGSFINKWVMKAMSKLLKNKSKKSNPSRLLGIGVINAYLPCGMVYVALLGALNAGNLVNSTLFMFVFGIGTLPGFIFLGALKDTFAKLKFFNKRVVLASLISIVGVFMILRGMNLGIPYISPKMEMVMAKHNKNNSEGIQKDLKIEAKMSCCSESKEAICSE
jgi:sulfite exporter TauE/SafE